MYVIIYHSLRLDAKNPVVTKNYQIVIIRSTIKDGVSVLLGNDFYPDVVCTN